jgi:hypothetical protein
LLDNGTSMDGIANDGIYGLGYVATLPGAYYVHLEATGASPLTGAAFTRYQNASFVLPSPKRPEQPGEGGPIHHPTRCTCEQETRLSIAGYVGRTFPHGSFNTVADPGPSLGLKVAQHFNAFGGRASLGLYLGRDEFDNVTGGSDFSFTHLSPELEIWPWQKLCPKPSLHLGAGAYRDETGSTHFGYNVGLGLMVCLNQRLSLLGRYDYRSVNSVNRDYSTLQLGLRWSF